METMTIKQAIAEGYTHYGKFGENWQPAYSISELTEEEVQKDDLRLFSKESFHPAGIKAKDLAELVAEHVWVNHCDDTGDDTDDVYDVVNALDFSDMEKKIDEALSKHDYWMLTDIKLIPETTVNP